MRIKSALALKRVNIKEKFKGDICLGFERLTCVPIQTKMVKMAMLSREEKQWLKVSSRVLMISFLCLRSHHRSTTNIAVISSNYTLKMISVHLNGCGARPAEELGSLLQDPAA